MAKKSQVQKFRDAALAGGTDDFPKSGSMRR
jgi:hypothetical protein